MGRLWCSLLLLLTIASAVEDPFAAIKELISEGRYALAAQFEGPRLVEAYPDEPEAHYQYARALYLTGDVRGASAELMTALELSGDDIELDYLWLRALLDAEEGELESAVALLKEIFAQTPSYLIAMDWGRLAWQWGDYNEATNAFAAAAQTDEGRTQPWPYINRARLLTYEGRYEEALTLLELAITIMDEAEGDEGSFPSPAYAEAFYRLGEIYERLADFDNARAYYDAALSVDPLHQPSIVALDRLSERTSP